VTESFHDVGRARCPASQTAELYVNTEILRRIRWIQWLTIAWMTVEVVLSFAAAWMARSPALVAFGGDSGIELLSAAVVLWRFRSRSMHERAEKQAARITAALLFMLAAYVIIASGAELLGHGKARRSPLGHRASGCCRRDRAVAGSTEAKAVGDFFKRGVAGRSSPICAMRLHGVDRSRRAGFERHLGNHLG